MKSDQNEGGTHRKDQAVETLLLLTWRLPRAYFGSDEGSPAHSEVQAHRSRTECSHLEHAGMPAIWKRTMRGEIGCTVCIGKGQSPRQGLLNNRVPQVCTRNREQVGMRRWPNAYDRTDAAKRCIMVVRKSFALRKALPLSVLTWHRVSAS